MGLLFSRHAPPPQRVHDVAFCSWFPAGLVQEVLGEHLALSPCLDRQDAWKHPEVWAASLSDDIRLGQLPVSPENYGARIKADSWSYLPAKAGSAGNQLPISVQQGWS